MRHNRKSPFVSVLLCFFFLLLLILFTKLSGLCSFFFDFSIVLRLKTRYILDHNIKSYVKFIDFFLRLRIFSYQVGICLNLVKILCVHLKSINRYENVILSVCRRLINFHWKWSLDSTPNQIWPFLVLFYRVKNKIRQPHLVMNLGKMCRNQCAMHKQILLILRYVQFACTNWMKWKR